MLIAVFDPLAVVLVISYNITLQVRTRDDEYQGPVSGKNRKTEKQKKPKRLGLYKEGKSVIEKVVKETFKPDSKIEKKHKEVIEEEPRGGVFVPEESILKGGVKSTNK
tara:strand:- start:877 stop:1200 length:324 start_codon:yes stop_codon:yes gene_type:complete